MRAFVSMLLACFVTPVVAQPSLTDAQKRRLHVPYVKAATFCIANAVRNDADFSNAVATDNFAPVIGRGWNACTQQLVAMAQAHDQIYGGGGIAFTKGAYSNDLERAVRKVLAVDIATARATIHRQADEQRAAQARAETERLDAERKEQEARTEKVALLEKSRDLIREKMFECIGREGASMVLTNENAEVVAKAAMIFCETDRGRLDTVFHGHRNGAGWSVFKPADTS